MPASQLETKGFFGALFDFSFTSFITLQFLKVIYAVLVGLICLVGLGFFVALLFRGGAGVVLAVVMVPLVTLLYLVLARVYMEVIALFFRIGESTAIMAAALGGAPGGGPGGGPMGGPVGDPPAGPSWGPAPGTGYPGAYGAASDPPAV